MIRCKVVPDSLSQESFNRLLFQIQRDFQCEIKTIYPAGLEYIHIIYDCKYPVSSFMIDDLKVVETLAETK